MGIANKQFEGIETNIPGIYSKSNFPPQGRGPSAASDIVVVLGSALGGIPYNASDKEDSEKMFDIYSPSEALDVLRGGNAYYMTEFYLTPTKDRRLRIPRKVGIVRVDPATHSTETLEDVGSNDIIDLESTRYGLIANQLARKIVAGTNDGYKATILFLGKVISEKDDIAMDYLEIQYSGAGSAATMSISATQLTTTCTGASTDDLTILFSEIKTLEELVNYINTQPNYTCTMLGRGDAKTTTFDAVTDQDIKTAAYTAKADVEALIQFLNNECKGEISASLHASAVRSDIDPDTGYVYFSGAVNGTADSTHWAGALSLLEKLDVNHILVASGDPSIHALVSAHCDLMSSIEGKKNRSWSAGSTLAKTNANQISEMKALNDPRSEYSCTPFNRKDMLNDGEKYEFDPFFGAALTAGIRFANGITASAEMQILNILSVTREYSRNDMKQLIGNGGTIFGPSPDGVEVIANVSTYQSANLILNLPPALRAADYITLDSQIKLKDRIKRLVTAPTEMQISELYNYCITNLLPYYKEIKLLTDDPDGTPAFSEVTFAIEGDSFYFGFTGIIAVNLRFGFITHNFTVVGQYK